MSRVKIISQSFLVENFHKFFSLLLRQKELALRAHQGRDPITLEQQAEKKVSHPDEPFEATDEKGGENPFVNAIQRRLALLLEEQAINSTVQAGAFAVNSYQDAMYAMVAFADETFLNIPWPEQKQWENNLLESRFFQTQIAGELVFEKIDALIAANDPMQADLAVVYLLILGLGFKGKFRDPDADPKQLKLYRQQLYRMINRRPSTLYHPGRQQLTEDCYEHVLDSTISKGLPEIRRWLFMLGGILGVYLFVSTVVWYKLAREMDASLSSILHQAQQMGLS